MKYSGLKKVLSIILIVITAFSLLFSIIRISNPITHVINESYGFFTMLKESLLINPVDSLFNSFDTFSTLNTVRSENEMLRKQIDDIAIIKDENEQLTEEVKRLKDMLNLDLVLSDYDVINGTVSSRSTNLYDDVIIIDVGSNDGVKEGLAVINNLGLVGKVVDVYNNSSKIRLLTTQEYTNKVSVKIELDDGKYADAVLETYDKDTKLYKLILLSANTTILPGKKVITSGMGGTFPKGVLVGTVKKIEELQESIALEVFVSPSVDFSDIEYIKVIDREKN